MHLTVTLSNCEHNLHDVQPDLPLTPSLPAAPLTHHGPLKTHQPPHQGCVLLYRWHSRLPVSMVAARSNQNSGSGRCKPRESASQAAGGEPCVPIGAHAYRLCTLGSGPFRWHQRICLRNRRQGPLWHASALPHLMHTPRSTHHCCPHCNLLTYLLSLCWLLRRRLAARLRLLPVFFVASQHCNKLLESLIYSSVLRWAWA